jgi:putative ABC transport system permease protein
MPLYDAIWMALRTLWAHKLKSFFSLVGVFIGVTFLIAVVSIVEGMNAYMEDEFTTAFIGVNTFQIRRRPSESFTDTREQRREWNRRPPLLAQEADYLRTWMATPVRMAKVCSAGLTLQWRGRTVRGVEVVGTEEAYFGIKQYEFERGRPFTAPERRARLPVAVLGAMVASGLLRGVDPIGETVAIMGIPHRVIGVVAAQGELFGMPLDKFAVVPFGSPMQRFLCEGRGIDHVDIQAIDRSLLPTAIDEAEATLRRGRGLRPSEPGNYAIETSDGALDTWNSISRVLIVALPGLVAISLVVGGVVIMNIMLMAVSERTHEIGIRKAVGARRRDIMNQFLIEALTLSLLGALLGVAAGIGLAFLLRSTTPLPAAVAPWSLAAAVGLGLVVGIGAGLYPANRAAQLDPIQALRAE